MKRHYAILVLSLLALPALAVAAEPKNLKDVITLLTDILALIIPFIFSLSIVAFLWGVAQYFFSQGEKMEEARDMMVYGVIALFVMLSVWGLVRILVKSFGFNTEIPQVRTGSVDTGNNPGFLGNDNDPATMGNDNGPGFLGNDDDPGSSANTSSTGN
jgi:hypothetical protein